MADLSILAGLEADLAELTSLSFSRSTNQKWLTDRITSLNTIISLEKAKQEKLAAESRCAGAAGQDGTQSKISRVVPTAIKTFSWDQTPKAVSVYHPLPFKAAPSDVETSISGTADSVAVVYCTKDGTSSARLAIGPLCGTIDPDDVTVRVKEGKAVVRLPKVGDKHWVDLIEKEQRKPSKIEDSTSSLMSAIKDLYDQGDSDMKRTLSKAMHEAQTKRNEPLGDVDDLMKF